MNKEVEMLPQKAMAVFKMCDSAPSVRYFSVCNVLRVWRISLISITDSNILYILEIFFTTVQ